MYFYLKDKSKEKTSIQLIYHCSSESNNFKISTGESISPEDWDFKSRMPFPKRGRDDLRAIRVVLERLISTLENRLNELKIQGISPTRENLRQAFSKKSVATKAVDIIDMFIAEKSKTTSAKWKEKYKGLKNRLKEYSPTINIDDINDSFVSKYIDWQIDTYNNTDNTLSRHVTFLKTFLLWATKKGYYHKEITYSVAKYQADDIALFESEIKKLEDYNCSGYLERTKDIALVGIYSGQRFSDYSIFERSDVVGNMLIKKAQKTGQESYIPLHPKLKKILNKYDWNLPKISNQKFNKYFKVLCEKAKINREFKKIEKRGGKKKTLYFKAWQVVSSHTCRRTYITLASQKGVPDEVIMKVTGIRDIKTLYKYKKISLKGVMDATEGLF